MEERSVKWYKPKEDKFPKDSDEVWVSGFNKINSKLLIFYEGDEKYFLQKVEAWCYPPEF